MEDKTNMKPMFRKNNVSKEEIKHVAFYRLLHAGFFDLGRTAQRYVPEYRTVYISRHEKLKSFT
jgi:hypothetical protein